jgi:hypothetical protein
MVHQHSKGETPKLTTQELSSTTWKDFDELFGNNNGVWGGCWCMFYHTAAGWSKRKSLQNREDKRALTKSGKSHGILVYCDEDPVGWCQFGPREELHRVDSKRNYAPTSADAWRVTCLFVDKSHRRMGVSESALSSAIDAMAKRKVRSVEAYPVLPSPKGNSASFLWSGTPDLFQKFGFVEKGPLGKSSKLFVLDMNQRIRGTRVRSKPK